MATNRRSDYGLASSLLHFPKSTHIIGALPFTNQKNLFEKEVAQISKILESSQMEPENISCTAWRFIHHFGEMGSRWCISRTVGQLYALLYISPQPLNADDLAHLLSFSRSNVSIGLKELQSWRLLRSEFRAGDRREYFRVPLS